MKKKLLLLEYVTGGGIYEPSSALAQASLMHEGELMIQALLNDCVLALPGCSVTVMRDARLAELSLAHCVMVREDFQVMWREQLQLHEVAWIIAPETDGVLLRLVKEANVAGLNVMNSSADAIELCSSKRMTSQYLSSQGIHAVTSYDARDLASDKVRYALGIAPVVVKPDDGAGCMQTQKFESLGQSVLTGNTIVQPYLAGKAMSLCVWCDSGVAQLLSVNEQLIHCDAAGVFGFGGCKVNVPGYDKQRLQRLAQRVHDAIPGLKACIGIDLIHTANDEWIVMEINPRMTTSFVALREATHINLASLAFHQRSPGNDQMSKTIEIRV